MTAPNADGRLFYAKQPGTSAARLDWNYVGVRSMLYFFTR
jgi:hypothetical protein